MSIRRIDHPGRSSGTRLRNRTSAVAAALCFLASGPPAAAGGTIIKISIPGSSETEAYGINDSGSITGGWGYAGGAHGFLRAADGTITTFDPPGANVTYGIGINRKGAICGYWIDYTGSPGHGFLRTGQGEFTTFDPEGSMETEPFGINDTGTIDGNYRDKNYVVH